MVNVAQEELLMALLQNYVQIRGLSLEDVADCFEESQKVVDQNSRFSPKASGELMKFFNEENIRLMMSFGNEGLPPGMNIVIIADPQLCEPKLLKQFYDFVRQNTDGEKGQRGEKGQKGEKGEAQDSHDEVFPGEAQFTREVHVRDVIRYLRDMKNYRDVLPEQKFFTDSAFGKNAQAFTPKRPKGVNSSEFGLLMEEMIASIVSTKSAENLDEVVDKFRHTMMPHGAATSSTKKTAIDPEDYQPLVDLVLKKFSKPKKYTRQVEWRHSGIVGHPDVVYGHCVYDVKTTHSFSSMRVETIYQLLCYYCLAQLHHLAHGDCANGSSSPITHIGLIAPLQLKIVTYDLSGWDWVPFWEMIVKTLDESRTDTRATDRQEKGKGSSDQRSLVALPGDCFRRDNLQGMTYRDMLRDRPDLAPYIESWVEHSPTIGHTVLKSHLHQHLAAYPGVPVQFFLYGNQKSSGKRNEAFIRKTRQLAETHGNKLYIHLPYTLNLSKPTVSSRPRPGEVNGVDEATGLPWVCRDIVNLMVEAEEMGVVGCVIHCGRLGSVSINYDDAVKTMIKSVKQIVKALDKTIPGSKVKLLIETSSGQGGETVTSPEEFIEFYGQFGEKYQKRLGVCVDTCHVFAAGEMPVSYFNKLDAAGIKVDLVHYNDSFEPFGSLKDRHAPFSQGCIGTKELVNVLRICRERDIDMVRE